MSSSVSSETVERAVQALFKWRDAKSETEKPQLLQQDEFFYLILTLKKIPAKGRTNPFKIPIPRPLIDPQLSEICLIIDDGPKSNLTKDAAQKKIKAENIPVSKVMKLSKLRSDFKAFEAKRKLCDSYDLFLADRRVLPVLPRLLGKQFFKKRKIPISVDLKHKGWKEQIENVCGSALMFLGSGTCSVVKVGKASMGKKEIAENVLAAINGVAEVVPRKWRNIRSFHLKMLESLALPIYQTVPDLKLKIEGVDDKGEALDGEEVNEEDAKESVVQKKKAPKRNRIHEVRYMDTNLDDEDEEDNGVGSAEITGKKRKKVDDKEESGGLTELSRAKKTSKVKGDGGNKEKKIEASKKSKKSNEEDVVNKRKKGGLPIKGEGELVGKKEKKSTTKPEKVKRNKK
ncbi:putative ribosome biogenesis protein C8F11.04 [Punica granatum]|uniref:Uncharacterized protein n=2 Tax=Punica granatum TaxID=22663 RepID=A0A218X0R1_PUNGR|nr:putative ribosome biogenesis protein C8F11.04 [Punica granatum]OWM78765.1 hypothetical protein CDL15_Pgr002936 [Punica granatum]PKI33632.1 hypothetical protein CRG98_045988 [Punica granatum]